jgi:hypothetical protein
MTLSKMTLSKITLRKMSHSKMSLNKTMLSIARLEIVALGITSLDVTALGKTTLSRMDLILALSILLNVMMLRATFLLLYPGKNTLAYRKKKARLKAFVSDTLNKHVCRVFLLKSFRNVKIGLIQFLKFENEIFLFPPRQIP